MTPRRGHALAALVILVLVSGVVAAGASLAGPAPSMAPPRAAFARPSLLADRSTSGPSPSLGPPPSLVSVPPAPTIRPAASPAPAPTATPLPPRLAVDIRLVADPAATFASESQKDWCSPAAVQMVLAIRQRADVSVAFQATLASRVTEWSAWADSHNGGWGPMAMASAIAAYGVGGYAVLVYETRAGALRGAATALSLTGSPVILLAWRGAHAWVMNGYRADADPVVFADANVTGAYVMDPWYPRVSSIWGRSDGPGVFQDAAEMTRNFLPWARPEGLYPERDGRFIIVAPVLPLASAPDA